MPGKFLLTDTLLKKISTILNVYYEQTGLQSIIIDKKAKVIETAGPGWLCRKYYCQNSRQCNADHILILKQALKWGGLFIYVCHKELILWSIPLTISKKLAGGIIAGFVLYEQYRDLKENYLSDFSAHDNQLGFINQKEIHDLSKKLFTALKQEKITDIGYLNELERRANVQKEIAEKIIEKKLTDSVQTSLIYEKQNALLNSIKYSEIEDIKSNLNDVLSEIYLEGINNIKLLKFRMLELFVLISRKMLECSPESNIENLYLLTSKYVKKSENLSDIYSFSLWLKEILNDFISHVLEKRNKIGRINQALDYIKNNLHKKLSLHEAAASIGLSGSRFLYLFKKETGMSFTDYVNKSKIEKAKELINARVYQLVDISNALNFTDQSYFTKIFKKYTGLTPHEYLKKQ